MAEWRIYCLHLIVNSIHSFNLDTTLQCCGNYDRERQTLPLTLSLEVSSGEKNTLVLRHTHAGQLKCNIGDLTFLSFNHRSSFQPYRCVVFTIFNSASTNESTRTLYSYQTSLHARALTRFPAVFQLASELSRNFTKPSQSVI